MRGVHRLGHGTGDRGRWRRVHRHGLHAGAGTWQTIGKVLLPLALPSVFNSLRLLFGLAFGYIMLAEEVKFGGETGGLGDLINVSRASGHAST